MNNDYKNPYWAPYHNSVDAAWKVLGTAGDPTRTFSRIRVRGIDDVGQDDGYMVLYLSMSLE